MEKAVMDAVTGRAELENEVADLRARLLAVEDRLAPLAEPIETVPFFMMSYAWVHRLAGVVADEWGCSSAELLGPSRLHIIVRPRFVLIWLVRMEAGYSLPQIGRLLNRDHTSMVHAINRVDGWRAAEEVFRHVTDQMLIIANRLRSEQYQGQIARARKQAETMLEAGR